MADVIAWLSGLSGRIRGHERDARNELHGRARQRRGHADALAV